MATKTTNYEEKRDELIAQIDSMERNEPECTCEQVDVDVFDNRNCQLCNFNSPYHRDIAAMADELGELQAHIAYLNSVAWLEE